MQALLRYVVVVCMAISIGISLVGCNGGREASNPTNQLDSILNNYLAKYGQSECFSAVSATIQCGSGDLVRGTAGTYQLDGVIPITTKSLFQIGSNTKSFTSVVILQLADDPINKLSLKDTVGQWFKNIDGTSMYPQWESVTILQLMNMSSGIPDYLNDSITVLVKALKNPTYNFSPQELVATVESIPVFFAPGAGYHYSNTNYILLGMLIQKITGNASSSEIQKRIINKLNLTNTYFPTNLPSAIVPAVNMINGYLSYADLPEPYTYLDGLYNTTWDSLSYTYTAGGIISTPEDVNIYIHALYKPGLILTESEIVSLTTEMVAEESSADYPNGGQPITQVSNSLSLGYGLGIKSVYSPNPPQGTGIFYYYGGATFGYGVDYMYFPALDMYMVFAVNNSQNTGASASELFNNLFEYAITTQCGESIPNPFVADFADKFKMVDITPQVFRTISQ